jgi:dipeptide/tripeptide permease
MDVIITPPNTLSMLWQIPQYVVITAAEIMFSISTLSFTFTEVNFIFEEKTDSFTLQVT